MINIQGISLTLNFPYFLKVTFKLYFLYVQIFYERFNKTISFILNFLNIFLSSITIHSIHYKINSFNLIILIYFIIIFFSNPVYIYIYYSTTIIYNKVPASIMCSAPLTTPGGARCGNYVESRWTLSVRILPYFCPISQFKTSHFS